MIINGLLMQGLESGITIQNAVGLEQSNLCGELLSFSGSR